MRHADEWIPTLAVGLLATGALLAASGVAAGRSALMVGGGAAAALALTVLMAGDWLDPLVILVLVLPLPALYASGDIRLAPAAPVTALVIAAWLLRWPGRTRPLRTGRVPLGWMALLLGAFVVAGLLSPHRGAAAREIANIGVLLLLLVAATDRLASNPGRAHPIAQAVAVVAGTTGALAVLETVGVLPGRFPEPGGLNRAALGFGQPNGLGMFLAIGLPLTVHARRIAGTRAGRALASLAVAGAVAGLVATFSRGAWLSVVAGAAALVFAGGWRLAARVWVLTLLVAAAADLVSGGVIRDAVFGLFRDWSVAQRAALMLAGIRMFLQQPWTGVGPGGFAAELERAGLLVPQLWDLQPTPHNAYIQMAAETGVPGLLAFIGFLAVLLVRAIKLVRTGPVEGPDHSLRLALLWAFAIALAEGMVEWPFSHGHGQLVVLTAAMICAVGWPQPTLHGFHSPLGEPGPMHQPSKVDR